MSKLNQIISFIAVVEENSFAAAAKKQSVSAAAISRQISSLEAYLKTKLLRRTTRHISLTETGAQYYQEAKKALEKLLLAEMAIEGTQKEAIGVLTVTSNRYFAIHHLLPRLPEFIALNPKLRVNLEMAERFPDLALEGIDLIFGMAMDGGLNLIRKKVASTRYVLCASPSYLEKFGTPVVPEDLSNHHYITHSMRTPNNVLMFKKKQTIQVEPILFLNDSSVMCDCAIAGMGIVNLHDYIVNDALKKGHLVELLADFQKPKQSIYLYYERNRYLQPKIRQFIDFYTT